MKSFQNRRRKVKQMSQVTRTDSRDETIATIRELHERVKDCFEVKPAIYWLDLTTCAVAGWASFVLCMLSGDWILKTFFMSVAAILLYRGVAFTHELVHVPKWKLPGFHTAWHFLMGIPLLAPHFLYRRIHLDHHKKGDYSTDRDAEYLPFARSPVSEICIFLFSGLVIPIISIIRFSLLSTLSLLHPKIRAIVRTKASSMGIQLIFVRQLPKTATERREWNLYETLCTLFCISCLGLVFVGVLPLDSVAHWAMLVGLIVTLNAIRGIGCTHYYIHDEKVPITLREQIEDSINCDSESMLTLILCPVGTRYHCLHHIFPSLPYHSLQRAHRRLMRELPEESFYRNFELPSIWTAWSTVWPSAGSEAVRPLSQLQ